MQICVVDSFFGLLGAVSWPFFEGTYQGWNIKGDPIIEKSQDQDQGQGQGHDHLPPQRSALLHFLVLALTLILVLRFFSYRVVPDIPCLITSLEKRSRNGLLTSEKTNRRHESA